ncbi:MAG: sensor histidine kinase [Lachnospiraceae bacterium]|nr:sensor histidine kinase [Lachnospiraceae bacterium]
MNKLRGSVTAKLLAWVLCMISLMGTIALGALTIVGIEEDFFHKTREEALQDSYENVTAGYSMDAFRNCDSSSYAKTLAENDFKFGIIQADSLRNIHFYDKQSYVQTNMTDEELKTVNPEKLFLYQIVSRGDFPLEGFSRGYYGDYDDISELDEMSSNLQNEYETVRSYLYADRICYDVAKGIIYYRADGKYYPVQNVSLLYDGSGESVLYNYSYDFTEEGYKLNYNIPANDRIIEDFIVENTEGNEEAAEIVEKADEAEALEETELLEMTDETEAAEVVERMEQTEASEETIQEQYQQDNSDKQGNSDKIEAVLRGSGAGSIVNLAALNSTTFNYSNWGTLILDNIRYIGGEELTLIDSANYSEKQFINTPGYYLNEDYTLVVETTVESTNYWVVSLIPEAVPAQLTDSNYYQSGRLVDLYYDNGLNIVQGFGISACTALISFVFLACAAGHRKNKQEIVLTFADRIPIDVLSLSVFMIEYILLAVCMYSLEEMSGWNSTTAVYLSILGVAVFVTIAIGIWYLLSLCVRGKNGGWWRNSICYKLLNRVCEISKTIFRSLNLLWKFILLTGVVSFVEFFVIAELDRGSIVLLWLMEKVVVCVILLLLAVQMYELQKASQHMAEGDLSYKIDTAKMFWECRKHGENLNKIGEGMSKAVDERIKSEHFKTELITNVSHDIKTPLTSIINYVDLLEKEELHNEKASEYLEVLERQSSKLKKLTEDLVEASKAASGSLPVTKERIEAGVFITQTVGEFEEKLSLAGLELVIKKPDEQIFMMADGRHLWRVFDNLMNNVCKYAQPASRVYVTLEASDRQVNITFRNMSKEPLNISGEELMQRFVRGDKSRNTEGHGLGLSIAQSLVKITGGEMDIIVDGDLFKVILVFDRLDDKAEMNRKPKA